VKPNRLSAAIEKSWYGERPLVLMRPLAMLYGAAVATRRLAYRRGWLATQGIGKPVLVVGNLTAGGSGKTPLVLAIVERALRLGLRPGVVARGYGGQAPNYPLVVTGATPAHEAGDEPVLIAQRTRIPVVVDPDRVRAARCLLDSAAVSLIIADDGLQHYRLGRDSEILVVDGRRGYGNGRLLPAGPLREPLRRASETDLLCAHGAGRDFWLAPGAARNLRDSRRRELASFERVHALAGIGDPARFFAMLRGLGLEVIAHAAGDHQRYAAADLDFGDGLPVLMTEKDGVKCAGFSRDDLWAVPVETVLAPECAARIDALLQQLVSDSKEGG
jgi:tetraacyldisaccharide 4'-kinase